MKKIIWKIDDKLVPYQEALDHMESMVSFVVDGKEEGLGWILEHNDVYTAGSSSKEDSLLEANKFPVYKTGRGGDYTYHGPGQIVLYLVIDLKKIFAPKEPDLKKYIHNLEEIVIQTLAEFGINAKRKKGLIGVWVKIQGKDKKIAAIGVRVRKWVAYHGLAINFNPDLKNFAGIIPCGIREYGVTSIEELNKIIDKTIFISVLKEKVSKLLGV